MRDTIVLVNSILLDGDARILFMPESKYPSGGLPRAVAAAKYNMQSRIDDANDKEEDHKLPRTHYVDDLRYLAWRMFSTGGRLAGIGELSARRKEELERMRAPGTPEGGGVAKQLYRKTGWYK